MCHTREHLGRCDDKDTFNKYHNDRYHNERKTMHATTEILTYNLGETTTIVAQRYNTREIVVHGTHEDATKRNPQEGYRAIACTKYSAEDWASTSNIKELYKENAPTR
jgi:hypothetical protein